MPVSAAASDPALELAAQLAVRLRWPEGVECPHCGASDISVRTECPRSKWRCRACRRDFTVTTGTALHGSKVGLDKWVEAARGPVIRPGEMSRRLEVSAPSARRMIRALESAGEPPGDRRLAALLSQPYNPGGGQIHCVPATISAKGDPTTGWTAAQRTVVGVLRNRPRGTTGRQIAAVAGLSERHVQRTLRTLADQGFTRLDNERVPWGCRLLEVPLWRLDLTERCVRALAFLPRRYGPVDYTCPKQIPAEFWPMFWSGARGSDARLPEDSLHVACTLLESPDRAAQTWALQYLPLETLKKCRTTRGYHEGETASALDAAIAERERVGNG